MNYYKLLLKPQDVLVDVAEGRTLKEAMNDAGLVFDFPCGGRGTCGKCRVKISKGVGTPVAKEQELIPSKELDAGVRLACMTAVYNDLTVELPDQTKLQHHILIDSEKKDMQVDPHLKKVFVEVDKPSRETHSSDWRRLKKSLVKQGYMGSELESSVAILRQMPDLFRAANYRITAVMFENVVAGLEAQDTSKSMLGMAFDIGTTTIVGYLLDLYSGAELCVVSTLNPQTSFGADVISRLTFVGHEEKGLMKLQAAVVEAINKLIAEAAERAAVTRSQIYGISIAANTCMHHLFLGINPQSIAVAPYVPAVSEPLVVDALELKIDINQAGKVFVLPNIAGFVGADTVAVLLATELDRSEDVKLVIDIGTNGEIALGSRGKIVACSAAAGPAFEGAQISSGMRGAVGAIDHVYYRDKLEYTVIGGGKPLGICGSALLDTVAGLVELGIINKRGKFIAYEQLNDQAAKKYKENLIQHEGQGAFLLADAGITGHGRPIMITQKDIRELQMAKGAIAAGIRILMKTCGVETEDIKEVLLAGAFGNYLNPHSACAIGLIPEDLESKIQMIGNAAGTGAKLALLSLSQFRRAADIAETVDFVELGSYPKFNSIFGECTYFTVK
ncbi:putative metal-binding protein [Desulfosporosinus acidiphilus SJ4]|uniref:Putative metal-binding protein n=1 Tax=Desulfosporosinus acidiphilus (strain DSM 22704 / JCM 16185 / SJ4) TaxID=646529 RepID=I4D7H3_DESAJ|nr:ASKHA domain-containing protein [Desulfosporosinus acidiphilus]AFM41747.1 putative metal-binding protein [Desulfosporosinus acidiphilus SJ4]